MNFFKLASCSVFRKPVKSLLLLAIVSIISTLLLAGMANKNASIQVQDKTRQAIGAGFLLEKNDTYRTKRIEELSNEIGEKEGELNGYYQKKIVINGLETWQTGTTNEFETLAIDDIERLAKTKGIADYNITTAITPVNPINFKRIEDPDNDQSADVGGVSLVGNRDMSLDTNVLSGNLHLIEGRMVTPKDIDVCVISEELASVNHLQVGDRIAFNDYHDIENSTVFEAEIIGIYQVDQKMSPLMQGDTYRSENVIFTDLSFPSKVEGEIVPLFQRAYFKVDNVDDYEEVRANLKKTAIDWEAYDLIDNNGNSEVMSSNFNDLAKVSDYMMFIVSAAGFMILVFIFLFWLKNRTHEIGIFLSLGIPKLKIIGQIWCEALLIALLSLMLSFMIAPAIAKLSTSYLVAQQVQQSENDTQNSNVSTDYTAPEQNVQKVEVTLTPTMYCFDATSVLLLITAAVWVSGITVLKKNPKDILSEIN